ncbi:galactosylceramide sulfotransferase-like [Panulirus ornatus]|uniref:galactosylceramide sulfotransferase-like n=1 Tax=Panulirus ornatus TaxID=150431 RepID=UPI003A85E20E
MDESLVLLKHLMCWSDEDVVAMARNVRKDRYRSYLSEHSVTTLEYFNAADVKLYAYFKERFEKQVESFGRGRMEEEVTRLKERRDKVWQQCGLQEAVNSKRRPHTDVILHTDKSSKVAHTHKGSQSEKGQHLVIQYEVHNNGSTQ